MYDSDEVRERVRAEVGRWMWEPSGAPLPQLSTVEQRTVQDAWQAKVARQGTARVYEAPGPRPASWRALFVALMALALWGRRA